METMNDNTHHRPALSFYHANGKGTGSALTVALEKATADCDGRLLVGLAPQESDAAFPCFDWPREVCVSLGVVDVCLLLQVLRGETESVADGKGLYIVRDGDRIRLCFRHMVEPINGYSLEVYALLPGGEERRVGIVLSSAEALGLCAAVEGGMTAMCFGA